MFATITYNIAIYTTNSYGMILVQKEAIFYGEKFVSFGYQLMLTLFVQLSKYCLLQRFLIWGLPI